MNTPLNLSSTALVIVDPQIDVLSPEGLAWDLVGEQVTENRVLERLVALRAAARDAGIPVFYSHLEIAESDYASFSSRNGLQALMAERKMMLPGKGARFVPELEPTSDTILLSPRKGPSAVHSDLFVQLQRRGIRTIILAGMIANLCVESHVRDATEMGFEAIVVGDAIATTGADAYAATLANFGLLATEVVDASAIPAALAAAAA